MQPLGIGRLVFLVRDFDASLAFYRDALGLPVRMAHAGGWAEFDAGELRLCLRGPWEGMPFDPATFGSAPDEILFVVPDLDAAVAALSARGVEVAPPHQPGPGLRVAEFHDPDGRRIAFEERAGPGTESGTGPGAE